jgi:hypothetical protein
MATAVANFPVYSEAQLEQTVTSYIAQGYLLSNRTPTSATMFKRKEFSILWLVIGLILCVVPLLVYLIIYANESDKMVQIYLADPATAPALAPPPSGQLSPDGRWQWNGAQWVPLQALSAPPAELAPPAETPAPPDVPPPAE